MEILGKLFGSNHIVKILRLFLFNPNQAFNNSDIFDKTKVPKDVIRIERAMLERIGFIKKRSFYKEVPKKRGRKTTTVKKRVNGWILDTNFVYIEALNRFLVDTATVDNSIFLKKLRKGGILKVVIVSGFFMGDIDETSGHIDLLIVGDTIDKKRIMPAIRYVEAETGKEIHYAVFSTKDFRYRLGIRDRLVRNVLDYPHKVLIDKLDIS